MGVILTCRPSLWMSVWCNIAEGPLISECFLCNSGWVESRTCSLLSMVPSEHSLTHYEPVLPSPGRSVAEDEDGDLFVHNSLIGDEEAPLGSFWLSLIFFFPPVASENVAIVIRRKDLPSHLLMSLSHLILSARLTIPWTPSLPFTFFMQTWGGWAKDVVDDWRACKPRRKGFCLSCEWFSLEIGTLDKSSFLALVIMWK